MTTLTATSTPTSGLSRERSTAERPAAHAAASDPEKWREALALASVTGLALALPMPLAAVGTATGPARAPRASRVEVARRVDAPAGASIRAVQPHGRDLTKAPEPSDLARPAGAASRVHARREAAAAGPDGAVDGGVADGAAAGMRAQAAPDGATDAATAASPVPKEAAGARPEAPQASEGVAAPGVWSGSPGGVRVNDRPATGRHDAADAPDMTAVAMDGRRTAEARPASAPGVSMPANHDRTAAHDAKTLARATEMCRHHFHGAFLELLVDRLALANTRMSQLLAERNIGIL
ncbi:MAG: hypothetical protein K6U88_13520 [Dehalococcoidia bacterium]|nr:hypothetical protein [Dehalococcoidia bacterium]